MNIPGLKCNTKMLQLAPSVIFLFYMQLDTEPSIVIVILNKLTVFTTSSETHLKRVMSDLQQLKTLKTWISYSFLS